MYKNNQNNIILVIDDDTRITNVIQALFKINNIQAVFASNAKEALALLIKTKIALVLCDMILPESDGFELLHFVKCMEDTKHIPFVFFTAVADPVEIQKGLDKGADDYITKPFLAKTLIDTIHSKLNANTNE